MVLQSSGPIKDSQITTEFGASFKNTNSMLGIAAGLPTVGHISFSQLLGKAASTPVCSTVSNIPVSTASGVANGSLNISPYVVDTYGAPLTYSAPTFGSQISSASLSGTTLSYVVPTNTFANTVNMSIVVTNRFNKTSTLTIPLFVTGYNISASTLPSQSITNNSISIYLPSYFTEYSGTGLTYSITSNPYSNAYISNLYLNVPGANRNTSYYVNISGTNGYQQTATSSTYITESTPPPTISANPGGQAPTFLNTTYGIYMPNYFNNASSYSVSSPYGNAYISGNYLYYTMFCRNTTYSVTMSATNGGGSVSQTFNITEPVCEAMWDPTYGGLYKSLGSTSAGWWYMACATNTGVGTFSQYGSGTSYAINFTGVSQHTHWRTGAQVNACSFIFAAWNITCYLFDAGTANESLYDFTYNNHWSLSGV